MISKEEIIEKVGVLLKELNDKFEYISNPNEDVNPLEFQLFEINAAYFAEHTNLLRKLEEEYSRDHAEVEESAEVHETNVEGTGHTQLKDIEHIPIADQEVKPTIFTPASIGEPVAGKTLDSQETVEEIEEEDPREAVEEKETIEEVLEPVSNKEEKNVSEEVKAQSQPEPEIAPEREVRVESASEPIKETTHEVVIEEKILNVQSERERPMSLNERLSAQRKAMDSEKQHLESPRRIKDIKAGINLNDKLMFIKDLFNGYSLAYSEAIELLNRFESFEDADRFLKTNYAQKNSWETKQASVEKLYAILRQRYG